MNKESSVDVISSKYEGNDNNGNPKLDYIEKVLCMSTTELLEECGRTIWLSSYANNNPHSDFHWQVDVCYDVCKFRECIDLYDLAWKNMAGGH